MKVNMGGMGLEKKRGFLWNHPENQMGRPDQRTSKNGEILETIEEKLGIGKKTRFYPPKGNGCVSKEGGKEYIPTGEDLKKRGIDITMEKPDECGSIRK